MEKRIKKTASKASNKPGYKIFFGDNVLDTTKEGKEMNEQKYIKVYIVRQKFPPKNSVLYPPT